ncbi:hypothetical protein A2363_04440 [Candidatus Gottesmanbacteria bacterium RIFOXYB1_FULL_47_11]|uniref:Glycosyltransferase RgtA/B/C/D-like domain-containing protein n=1 Tax=Candidatus Gottesmanbacteria bacterium RIFOXYB1_FULL_47_11 TaxID=1798401 RepID=A0A1F6BFC1_9BACT|nr:MAG: hypothetical protein A2363_04440 [Candidatus Gottesmanbacteria bacterium RIFOXYB1_FULL_47_11]
MKKFFPFFLFFFLSFLLVFLLYWRFRVSTTRFFDVDEFSYLHWTAQMARGEHMYTDFFSYFTPGFMWVFSPIFWIYGASARVFTAARGLSFVIFLSILTAVSYVWGITRGWKWALLPAVILAFLPMPYDKLLEIRPDNLSTLLAIIGLIGEIRGIRENKNSWWFVSGLAYSASLLVLAKTVPIVAVGAGIAVLSAISSKSFKSLTLLILGLVGPWALFFLGVAAQGNLDHVWYSLTRLPFEVYKSPFNQFMDPTLFFFPNSSFYGGTDYIITTGLLTNHGIWILAVMIGVYRLMTPFLTANGNRKGIYIELLLALTFVIQVFGYIKLFPARHSQYLIPIAVFIAYYTADGLVLFFEFLARVGGIASLIVVMSLCGCLLVFVTQEVNVPKLIRSKTVQLAEIDLLMKSIPFSSRVVDMEGRMLFWAEGYPVCCLAIDSTLSFVTRRPPPLDQYLAVHPADYIWENDTSRYARLNPATFLYMQKNYEQVPGWDGRLWKKL